MACKLRDRDAIISKEGIIFRVYGYSHPSSGYICDVEYASSNIYQSTNVKALRQGSNAVFFKFFEDSGLKFVEEQYPHHRVYVPPLRRHVVGVKQKHIGSTRLPVRALQNLLHQEREDELLRALKAVLHEITSISNLTTKDFGVFGSLLHNFYHPTFSDIDLIIIGTKALRELRDVLTALYEQGDVLINEFTSPRTWSKSRWKFTTLSLKEYGQHQRRKLIYGIYNSSGANRRKVEFEPVRDSDEVYNEYDENTQFISLGWVEAFGEISEDAESGFLPSIYGFQVYNASNPEAEDACRIVSYVEEFRMQVKKGEKVFVAGNLERVTSLKDQFYQVTLTYGPRYYEQTLKKVEDD